jgi:hypothetical protein
MIAIRLQGRLGNQIFQYAFIMAASKKLGTRFYIDQFVEESLIHRYFEISPNTIDSINLFLINKKGCKNIFSYYLRKSFNKYVSYAYNLKSEEYKFAFDDSLLTIKNNILYIGYFQSLFFLTSFENSIRRKLVIKKAFSKAFIDQFGGLYQKKTIVTIHVRRTDYKNLAHLNLGADDLSLPMTYYQSALLKLTDKNLHYIFISDDITFVEENFDHITPKTISNESEIFDFQHLLNADICIISNSTFSWWGAWLNSKENKTIYCPKYYLGFHLKKQVPQNIYPKEWRQVEFT